MPLSSVALWDVHGGLVEGALGHEATGAEDGVGEQYHSMASGRRGEAKRPEGGAEQGMPGKSASEVRCTRKRDTHGLHTSRAMVQRLWRLWDGGGEEGRPPCWRMSSWCAWRWHAIAASMKGMRRRARKTRMATHDTSTRKAMKA
jgi:hypothetical protein